MSILIRGMEMPKNCDSCPCYYETEGAWRNECEVLQREHYITNERPDWCPLVPVPPHGRLIDADALATKMRGVVFRGEEKDVLHHNMQVFLDAPTIIEAEEGE